MIRIKRIIISLIMMLTIAPVMSVSADNNNNNIEQTIVNLLEEEPEQEGVEYTEQEEAKHLISGLDTIELIQIIVSLRGKEELTKEEQIIENAVKLRTKQEVMAVLFVVVSITFVVIIVVRRTTS